jgi:hypothetical protein
MSADIQYLKLYIDNLFKKHFERELSESMNTVSEFYEYFANNIEQRKLHELDKELVQSFESVYMWLRDKLLLYPSSIKEQVENIVNESSLLKLFALLSFLTEDEIRQARKRLRIQEIPIIFSFFLKLLYGFPKINYDNDKLLSRENILNTKISLNRLSQIVKYVSSYELVDYDESYESFKEHFNPNIVDKNKIFAFINIIKVQASQLPNKDNQKKILDRLDELEAEVKKKNPRWGLIISGFFMLLGFLADLKTIEPNVYENIYKTTSQVISVIIEDGQVQKKSQFHLNEFNQAEQDATKVNINNQIEE